MDKIKSALFICLLLCGSCGDSPTVISIEENDTSRILKESIRHGLSDRYMPEASALHIKYRFGDSILLTSDKFPLDLLPSQVDAHFFKKLSFTELCNMIQADSLNEEAPNILVIYDIEKNDTGYSVLLGSRSCIKFGGGGTLSLDFQKVADSLIVVGRHASSKN
ncbi:hypothetical protein ACX0G7_27245 [Flavitalea antarctica]